MAASRYADCQKHDKGENNYKSHAYISNLRYADTMMSILEKRQNSEGLADAQIWRWKSQNERLSNPIYVKENGLSYNASVYMTLFPADDHYFSDESLKKRRAQNRAAQKAFRARQKRTYRDLQVRNKELVKSMEEALQEISGLRSLVDSMLVELKASRERKPVAPTGMKESVCSAKCHSKAVSAGATESSIKHRFGDEAKAIKSRKPSLNGSRPQHHTNACLFQRTAMMASDQHITQHSSASNEVVATMQLAKRMCIQHGSAAPQPTFNRKSLYVNCHAEIPAAVPWLMMDASISADQVDASAYLESISSSSSSLQETGPTCGILMKCLSCWPMQQGCNCYETGSSNFPSTPLTDNDNLEILSSSSDLNVDTLQLYTDTPRVDVRPTDTNDASARFLAPFGETCVSSCDHTILSGFGFGEMNWFEAPY